MLPIVEDNGVREGACDPRTMSLHVEELSFKKCETPRQIGIKWLVFNSLRISVTGRDKPRQNRDIFSVGTDMDEEMKGLKYRA